MRKDWLDKKLLKALLVESAASLEINEAFSFKLCGIMKNYKTIFTKKGQEIKVFPEDYEMLNQHTWYIANGYAVTNIRVEKGKQKTL